MAFFVLDFPSLTLLSIPIEYHSGRTVKPYDLSCLILSVTDTGRGHACVPKRPHFGVQARSRDLCEFGEVGDSQEELSDKI
jgi:hypothetical protein